VSTNLPTERRPDLLPVRLVQGLDADQAAVVAVLAGDRPLVAVEGAETAGPGRVAVLTLGYCGLRWSELAALRMRHFDLLRRRVLTEEAVTEVARRRRGWCGATATPAPPDWTPPPGPSGSPASPRTSCGTPRPRWRSRRGANVKAVQRMLGHASAAMTLDRYADLFDDDLDDVADRLDTLRASSRGQVADFCGLRRSRAAPANR
jgi:site-specific recombinase XerC